MTRTIAHYLFRRFVPVNHVRYSSLRKSSSKSQDEETRREVKVRGLPKQKPIKEVKQSLPVALGKGGVGQSITSVNLATTLKVTETAKVVYNHVQICVREYSHSKGGVGKSTTSANLATALNLMKPAKVVSNHVQICLREYSSSSNSSSKSQDEEARRRQVMARGLPKQKPIKGVKQILLVASGKGGVGKSTTSVNLATALKIMEPAKDVGLLDADIFGPTIPLMMNLHQSPMLNEDDLMEPLINYGVKCMSMGFLIDEKSPVVWRGLMVMSALDRLLRQVAWGPLDYLVVDTPPGTGDTLLSLTQNLPISGVLIVTTPQRAALEVARRGAKMFQKLNVPIAGIVENMTSVTCPKCRHEVPLFGEGATPLAEELGTKVLKKFPMHEEITESSDKGRPIVLSAPKSVHAESYKQLATEIIIFLEKQPKSSN